MLTCAVICAMIGISDTKGTPMNEPVKPCSRCKQIKPLAQFPADKRASSGRASRCNACMSEILAAYKATPEGAAARKRAQHKYQASPEGQEKRREYQQTPKSKEQRRRYAHTEKGHQVMLESRERNRQKAKQTREGKLRIQAEAAVGHAVEAGRLPSATTLLCSGCGNPAEHYHHYLDYEPANWLAVVPLCRSCHTNVHKLQPS